MVQKRFAVFQNLNTAQYFYVDLFLKRYSHMCDRLNNWHEMILGMYPYCPAYHLTLTYDMKKHVFEKKQISKMVHLLMQNKRIYEYAWVCELQRNGNPHYHVICVAENEFLYKWDYGFTVCSGPWELSLGYLLEHSKKAYQKDFANYPKGARLFGVSKVGGLAKIIPEDKESESSEVYFVGWEDSVEKAQDAVDMFNRNIDLVLDRTIIK
jgi:hypothetical protein